MKRKIKGHIHKIKKKSRSIYDRFDRKDVAQMLTSIFVIVQVFTLRTTEFGLSQSLLLFTSSLIVCGLIVWIMAGKDFLKHLFVGVVIVSIFSFLIGYFLSETIEKMLIAFALGLPVATMVNALKK